MIRICDLEKLSSSIVAAREIRTRIRKRTIRARQAPVWFAVGLLLGCCQPAASAENGSGIIPAVLSLPSGPGSIEGLGGRFDPNLNTGTSSYEIPLETPPGRGGFAPELALAYNSGLGSSCFGLGWRLATPFIERQSQGRQPFYTDYPRGDNLDNDHDGIVDEFDEFDVFYFNGRDELTPAADGFWRRRVEESFTRFTFEDGLWTAERRDGVTLTFGKDDTSRVTDGTGRVYQWRLTEMTDPNGNKIRFHWKRIDQTFQVYCQEIAYNEGFQMRIEFEHERRPDPIVTYRPGFELKTRFRCRAIKTFEGPRLVRLYSLEYEPSSDVQPHSLLSRVTNVGADGTSALPPARFDYVAFRPDAAKESIISAPPPVDVSDGNIDLLDVDGDALPDFLDTTTNPHGLYMNLGPLAGGDIAWSDFRFMRKSIRLHLAAGVTALADLDGNSRTDLLNAFGAEAQLYVIDHDLEWERRPDIANATFSLFDSNTRLVDANGDRFIDVIQTDGGFHTVWICLNAKEWSRPYSEVSPAPWIRLDQPQTRLADMNGDRLLDLVHIANQAWYYLPNKGYGQFGAQIDMTHAPDGVTDDAKLALADVNGDGLTDALHLAGDVRVWLNLGLDSDDSSRQRVAPPFAVPTTQIMPETVFRRGDLNGNGSIDLIFNTSVGPRRGLSYLDFAPDEQPYQLKRIDNGIGLTTTAHYRTSVVDAVRDRNAGKPWPSPVPIPISVISSLDERAFDSRSERRFQYHDGFYDAHEEQFNGFARAEQLSVGDDSADGLLTNYRFHLGRVHHALKGKMFLEETGDGESASEWPHYDGQDNDNDGLTDEADEFDPSRLYYRETSDWRIRVVAPSAPGATQDIAFPFVASRERETFERDAGTGARVRSEFEYDDFGNRVTLRELGRDGDEWRDDRLTISTYSSAFATGQERWILDRLVERSVLDGAGVKAAQTLRYYDDSDQLGAVTAGNLTKIERWVSGATRIATEYFRYDAFGNIVEMRDGLYGIAPGHSRHIDYDPVYHTFPVAERIATGDPLIPFLELRAEYDARFGVPTSSTDPNGNITAFQHDAFGRIVSITKAPDASPTVTYHYALGQDVGVGEDINWIESQSQSDACPSGYVRTRTFYDGLGRKIMVKQESEPAVDGAERIAVTEATTFNSRGEPRLVMRPYYSTIGASVEQLLAFEDTRAPQWRGLFHIDGALKALKAASAPANETVYDALLRPVKVSNPDGTFQKRVYEPLLVIEFDENDTAPNSPSFDTPRVQIFDGLNRLTRVEEVVRLTDSGGPAAKPQTWSTQYSYDANDNLVRIVDSQRNVKTFGYDGLSRPIRIEDPNRGTMIHKYDHASNLIESIDAKGQRIRYTYDGANRVKTEDYLDEDSPVSLGFRFNPDLAIARGNRADIVYFYDNTKTAVDQGDGTTDTARNLLGNLARVWDTSGEEHFSYDARNRIEWTVKRFPDRALHSRSDINDPQRLVSYRTGFAHNSADRVTSISFPDGDAMELGYDRRHLLKRVPRGALAAEPIEGEIVSDIHYLPSGQVGRIILGNGVEEERDYDSRGRIKAIRARQVALGVLLNHLNYELDGAFNVVRVTNKSAASDDQTASSLLDSQSFSYDDLYRLSSVEYASPGSSSEARRARIDYRHDRIGNILAVSHSPETARGETVDFPGAGLLESGGAENGRWNRFPRAPDHPPGPHAVTAIYRPDGDAVRIDYDANGNLVTKGSHSYQWDFKDRLVAVETPRHRVNYSYDHANRRVAKRIELKANESDTAIASEPAFQSILYVNRYFEVRNHSAPTKYLWRGEQRMARITGSVSHGTRVQRLRIEPGWNLRAVAVEGARLPSSANAIVTRAFVWSSNQSAWRPLNRDEPIPAHAALWLFSERTATIPLRGAYSEPWAAVIPAGPQFVGNSGLRPWAFLDAAEHQPIKLAWSHASESGASRILTPSIRTSSSEIESGLAYLAVGEAVFILSEDSLTLTYPKAHEEIVYFHQDHLGSTAALSDRDGNPLDRVAYFPYGSIRAKQKPGRRLEPYLFTQKERCQESGLDYFERRHYSPILARFLSPDPLTLNLSAAALSNPQSLNPYAYSLNNPMAFHDPEGEFATLIGTLVGAVVGGAVAAYQGEDVAAGALSGAVAGAVAGVVIDTGGTALGLYGAAAAGASGNVAGGWVDRALSGQSTGIVDITQDAVLGAGLGAAGSKIFRPITRQIKSGIVASNGIRIHGFTKHAVNRAIGDTKKRVGVSPQAILDALKSPIKVNPVAVDKLGRPSQRFIGKTGEVVVNPTSGKIISVNPTSKSKMLRLLKQKSTKSD